MNKGPSLAVSVPRQRKEISRAEIKTTMRDVKEVGGFDDLGREE